MHKLKSKEER